MKVTHLHWLTLCVFAIFTCALPAHGQLPVAQLTNITPLASCPSNLGFYTTDSSHPMSCTSGKFTCSQTDPITITYGVSNPGGTKGTVVFFTGGGGQQAAAFPGEEQLYAQAYIAAGYQVVQTSWSADWENTNSNGGSYEFNIRTAACRPASFLKYVYQNIYTNTSTTAGMCAQGASAGSGAIAYSLAWYGASQYLDKVSLSSGPVFSDIQQGCQVPKGAGAAMCPSYQFACNGWTQGPNGQPIIEPLNYTEQANQVEAWSGGTTVTGPTCSGGTTTTWNAHWLHMSIVDLSGVSGTPSFNYPQTSMTSWLCASDQEGTQNNSGPQGELFYQQFTGTQQFGGNFYQVNAVTNCQGEEGVGAGVPPPSWVTILQSAGVNPSGSNAIAYDMYQQGWQGQCTKRH